MTEKQPKAKSGLRRFAGDMVYSLAGLMILNMTILMMIMNKEA